LSYAPVTLGLKFRSDVSGTISGIRFYKGAGNNGTHTGLLYSATGTLLAQAAFTAETASGWQQATFATPVAIQANTTYIAAYFSSSGFAYNAQYFAVTGVDNAPLHALRSGVDGSNSVFANGATPQFPSLAGLNANYWADVVFSTTPPAPTPDLTIAKSHTGSFTQGQAGATYTMTVTNSGSGPTSGTVTVTETLPATGLTAVSMLGTNWTCTQPAGPCSRSDIRAAGLSYEPITLTVNVSAAAPASVTNCATVSGGGARSASVTQPANGAVVITGGGTGLTYAPNANYCNSVSGPADTFTYTLTPGSSSTTVTVTVTCVDDPPVAVADAATVVEDSGANAINVLANDTDVDAGPKSVASVTQPANGAVAITGGGTGVSYTPNANYCNQPPGTTLDTFTYTLTPAGPAGCCSSSRSAYRSAPCRHR
jgi:hypothetical protein